MQHEGKSGPGPGAAVDMRAMVEHTKAEKGAVEARQQEIVKTIDHTIADLSEIRSGSRDVKTAPLSQRRPTLVHNLSYGAVIGVVFSGVYPFTQDELDSIDLLIEAAGPVVTIVGALLTALRAEKWTTWIGRR